LALNASGEAMPFDMLFLSFSFFIITAALMLSGLLFVFGAQQRSKEVGTLLALGYTPARVRGLMLREGLLLAVTAAVVGGFLGTLYTKAILNGLTTIWRNAIASAALQYHATPLGLVIGGGSSVLLAVLVIFFILRKQVRSSVHQILTDTTGADTARVGRYNLLAAAAFLGAIGLLAPAFASGNLAASTFFSAGSLLLLGGMALIRAGLGRSSSGQIKQAFTPLQLTVRNLVRRRGRSMAAMALLACGSFIVISIEANRLDANLDADRPESGTGGFTFFSELTQPVLRDLNLGTEQDFYGLDTNVFEGVSFVPFRVMKGDEASCLNLNRAQQPRLLGVDGDHLKGRFTFAKILKGFSGDDPWTLLKQEHPSGAIPAIGDMNSIQWALMKNVGKTLEYTDERGQSFEVILVGGLANSIMQGNLLMDEHRFSEKFPSASGYQSFLIDVGGGSAKAVDEELAYALEYYGINTVATEVRLASFNNIQNTYLKIFQVLGGLGRVITTAEALDEVGMTGGGGSAH
ncbi:MAG: ABC transporter permease, partial [Verrucomicrobiota bacterium]